MDIENTFIEAIEQLYQRKIVANDVFIQKTRKDFVGDFTVNVYAFIKYSKKPPEKTAKEIGEYLKENVDFIESYNIIKGFLNIEIKIQYWIKYFNDNYKKQNFGFGKSKDEKPVVIEYSSPNTNKPLHLGHIRNNLIGWSIAQILEANGKKVNKVNLVNDRGIHICKSMLAWERWGKGETPATSNMKGDHLVGKYYVLFDKLFKQEIQEIVSTGTLEEVAEKKSTLLKDAQEMLREWEAGDKYTLKLWKKLNKWVYEGFDVTYKKLGIDFDKTYYESETYLEGKKIVEKGLKDGYLYKKEDNSTWVDVSSGKLGEKLLLRADGTSVYITQDLGTAKIRHDLYDPQKLIYVVGNEQNYHFDVLKIVLRNLGFDWSEKIYHLSYGMVELPHGKMKSREGKVVDADDLIEEMYQTAKSKSSELGKIKEFSDEETENLYRTLSIGALKYFILKVDPQKNMLFNPEESIDFNGNTGPFIQYTYARIQSLLKKASERNTFDLSNLKTSILPKEKEIIKLISNYPVIIKEAGEKYSPALIANYVYDLAKEYNQYYHDTPVLKAKGKDTIEFRLCLSQFVGNIIKSSMGLLGIDVPSRM